MDFKWGTMEYRKVLLATMPDLQEKKLNSRQKSTERKWGIMAPPTPDPSFEGPVLYII